MGTLIVKKRTNIHLKWPYQISRRRVVSSHQAVADAVDDQKSPDDLSQCWRCRQNYLHVFVSSFVYVVIEKLVDSMVVIFIITSLERNCFLVVVKSFCANAIVSDLHMSLIFNSHVMENDHGFYYIMQLSSPCVRSRTRDNMIRLLQNSKKLVQCPL